jgi:hypothetical protein
MENKVYSTNPITVRGRIYLQDLVKYAKSKQASMDCAYRRYHSENEEIRNRYREQRKIWNARGYEKRKLKQKAIKDLSCVQDEL